MLVCLQNQLSMPAHIHICSALHQERRDYNYNEDPRSTADTADAEVVWKRYQDDGCSIRLLHPQRFCTQIATVLAKLEDVFSSCAGCNVYLTPPGAKVSPSWLSASFFSHTRLP